jgi:hypothetical protein
MFEMHTNQDKFEISMLELTGATISLYLGFNAIFIN